ncbi:MAG: Stk1 family PASTA domain-containing Ser/Thr kinase [Actinomycetota bacterium]|nr:Stk1 family PASTA domain-containing Ser/Thr kinase [Actinomycetota bacterium]
MTETPDEPIRLGDRYELGGLLGRGGMADVRVGRDLRLGRTVAVKQLRSDLASDPTFQERFRREAQSAASLNHPAVVAVYDTGESLDKDGHVAPYIVMEYVEGQTLRDVMRDGRKLLPERALDITADVLSALDYSHRSGIVHRDIKPANIMLTPSGQVKVMDFGIARAIADASSAMTQTAAVIGTAQYLSPEQARGETVDARSDIYSTGCLLYELLTGRPPFVGDSPVSVAYQHVREEARPPSSLNPDVSSSVDAIVAKSLAKRTDDRYQSAADMRKDIDRLIAGHQIEAPSASTQAIPATTGTMVAPVLPAPANTSGSGGEHVDEDTKASNRKWWLIGAVVVLLLAGVTWGIMQMAKDPAPVMVNVPSVTDKTFDVAKRALEDRGFVVADPVMETSQDVPKDDVISQDPEADTSAEKGTTVTLTVSSGPGKVTIPNLDGFTFNQAKTLLEGDQFKLKVKKEDQDSDLAAGQVINSDPPAGTSVDVGSNVTVKVSRGQVTVPNLVGMDIEDAQQTLDDLKLKYTTKQDPASPEPKDSVTAQSVAQGEKVPPGTSIELTVSGKAEEPSTDADGAAAAGIDGLGPE